ncbi:sigma-70 family RNA polymerase sigma factor [bacterium]|nr:sigma-70 family RNA polymerase sigma factor [bacterium]
MPPTGLPGVRRLATRFAPDPATDGELLTRFLDGRDEEAFAALVGRHAPMVFGTCRRVLGNQADADDAFQAAFVVLVRRGRSLTDRSSVGGFLHGVAYHTALKARAMAAKRRAREAAVRPPEPPPDRSELLAALDAELAALPEHYRGPVVLCELEGRTRREAAAALGVPEGTISSRLATAHRLLGKRLRARGFAGAAPAVLLAGAAAAPGRLTAAAVRAAADGPSPTVSVLVSEVLKMMLLHRLRVGGVALAVAVVFGAAAIGAAPRQPEPGPRAVPRPGPAPAAAAVRPALPPQPLLFTGHTGSPSRVAVTPDGKHLITVSGNNGDRTIRVWDYQTGKELRRLKLATPYPETDEPVSEGWEPDQWISLAVSPGGTRVVTGSLGGLAVVWDFARGKELRRLAVGARVAAIGFSPDGRHVLTATREGRLAVWDAATGERAADWSAHGAPIRAAAFLPDGKRVVSAGYDKQARVWDAVTREELFRCEGHAGWVEALAVSRRGKWFLTGSDGIWKWDAETGKLLAHTTVPGMGGVTGLALSPDESRVVAVSYDGSVRVFGVDSGELLKQFDGQVGWLWGVAFAPDGLSVVTTSGGHDGRRRGVWTPADFAPRKWDLTR